MCRAPAAYAYLNASSEFSSATADPPRWAITYWDSFDGTATVTDVRTTGAANPWCALVQTGADTYDAVGGKA